MINENMTAEEIIAEIESDRPHCLYQLKKSYGGARKMDAALQKLVDTTTLREGESVLDHIEQYTSGYTGNKYIVYSYIRNIGFGHTYYGTRCFAYWDTDEGSIAVATMGDAKRTIHQSALIFSGHFFKRYAEREHLGDVDLQLVSDFMLHKHVGLMAIDPDVLEDGVRRFDVILPTGIGRGHTREFYPDKIKVPFVSYVRTYLPNAKLNVKQRLQTAASREQYARVNRPADTIVSAFIDDDGDSDYAGNICEEIFLSRNLPAGSGTAFYYIMSNLFCIEILRQVQSFDDLDNKRAILLKTYYTYANKVFDFVNAYQRSSYTGVEIIRVAMLANPDFDTVTAAVFLISKGLSRLNFSDKEIAKRIDEIRDYLSQPENKITFNNVHKIFANFKLN